MEVLKIHDEDGVRTLTLNRPDRLNAMNDALSSQLLGALAEASKDDTVRVVVITGTGRGFCTGLDLTEANEMFARIKSRHQKLDELGWVGHQALTIVNCDKPVIAAINGMAAGAGLALALACDLRFMAASARVTTGYIRRALNPDAGLTYFLPRIVGQTRAAELILTGRDIDANEALQIGLVNRVFEDDTFHSQVMAFAKELAQGPPIAMTFSKRLLTKSLDTDLESLLKQEFAYIKSCFATNDLKEGVQAFLEKRKPNFRGE
jgi:2-(1,2-epoxy-1,2-dihydrophenyl)acetyl-CoA isomerase